jgi:hypothetical protein
MSFRRLATSGQLVGRLTRSTKFWSRFPHAWIRREGLRISTLDLFGNSYVTQVLSRL